MRIARICRNLPEAPALLMIRPDATRRIDLPGAGPCPRPIDVDGAAAGFSRLVALRVYSFVAAMVIDGEAEGDEVFITLMQGQADIAITEAGAESVTNRYALRRDQGLRAVYLPPHACYRLTAVTDCDIAYVRADPGAAPWPAARGFAPVADQLSGAGHARGMDLSLATVMAGSTARLGGDGGWPERFVHLRAGDGLAATIGDAPACDWDAAALNPGEPAWLKVTAGAAEVLMISAVDQQAD